MDTEIHLIFPWCQSTWQGTVTNALEWNAFGGLSTQLCSSTSFREDFSKYLEKEGAEEQLSYAGSLQGEQNPRWEIRHIPHTAPTQSPWQSGILQVEAAGWGYSLGCCGLGSKGCCQEGWFEKLGFAYTSLMLKCKTWQVQADEESNMVLLIWIIVNS